MGEEESEERERPKVPLFRRQPGLAEAPEVVLLLERPEPQLLAVPEFLTAPEARHALGSRAEAALAREHQALAPAQTKVLSRLAGLVVALARSLRRVRRLSELLQVEGRLQGLEVLQRSGQVPGQF